MALKKKVVMKAASSPEEKEKILKFNQVVRRVAKNKFETVGFGIKPRELVKVIGATSIKVSLEIVKGKLKTTYKMNSDILIDKSYSTYKDFDAELTELENTL